MAHTGISCGHDLNFHQLSWMETVRAWHTGLWYPHWIQSANYGAGEPRLVFYPPASWNLGALLGTISSWSVAPALFLLVTLLASGWTMYWLAREYLTAEIATLTACLYVANPYALFAGYERSAYGELLAGAWIPLILLFATRKSSSVVALAFAVAAVWLTDAPAAVIAGYMLAVVALGMMWIEREAWPGLRAIGGILFGIGVAAFYVVPAAYERRWVEIGRVVTSGLRVEDSFLFERTGDSFHDQVLSTASWILLLEVATAAIAFCLTSRYRRSRPRIRALLAVVISVIFFLQFRFSDAIWNYAPELRFVQFPWRWLLVLSPAACLLGGMALDSLVESPLFAGKRTIWWLGATAGVVIVVTIGVASRLFFQPCDDEDAIAAQVAAFRSGNGVEGTDEYTPAGRDNSRIQQGLPFLRLLANPQDDATHDSDPENPMWQPGAGTRETVSIHVTKLNAENWRVQFGSKGAGYAVLCLMDYPAWEVTLNGFAVSNRALREDGLMTIPVAAGSNVIEVHWRTTRDVTVGRIVSTATIVVLVLLSFLDRNRRERGSGQSQAVETTREYV